MAVDEQESAPRLTRPDSGNAGRRGLFRTFRPVRSVHEPPRDGPRRRRSLELIALVAVCAIVGGGTGLTAILTRSTRHSTVRSPAATCVAPQATPTPAANAAGENASRHLGTWGFNLLEAGTFGSVVAGPGSSLYALQACGAEETQLRVLHLAADGDVLAVSVDFDRAALLTSSLVLQGGSLYVGAARLDLSGPVTDAPYELTLYRLNATTLHVLRSRPLGRGYGLSLLTADAGHSDATVLASTGARLLAVQAGTVSVRTLASFGRSVAQHVSADPRAPYAAVSVFAPGAVAAAAGATVELLDARTGGVVSSARLVAGAQVASLAFGEGSLFVALGDGLSTEVRRFAVPDLATPGPVRGLPTGLPATLQTILLDDTGGTVWATDLTMLACLDSSTGRVLSLSQSSASMSVSGLVGEPGATYAVTASGIGLLEAPAACRDVAVG
jgi:hypothetical protein